ncbi:hypothetical protein ACQKP0_14875 [Heyndrickxia sp. NPDC080065]|uniref:hypothetical protein n=1 Tax=Heyndrickxia sp. NPDC080065 TaxID=3390568 RepID=UPI003D086043
MKVLLAKLIIDDAMGLKHQKAQSDIRKAMLENKTLTQTIADYMDNVEIMKQVEKYLESDD